MILIDKDMNWIELNPLDPLPTGEVLASDGELYLLGELNRVSLAKIYCAGKEEELPNIKWYCILEKPGKREPSPIIRISTAHIDDKDKEKLKEALQSMNHQPVMFAPAKEEEITFIEIEDKTPQEAIENEQELSEHVNILNRLHEEGESIEKGIEIASQKPRHKKFVAQNGEPSRWEQVIEFVRKHELLHEFNIHDVGDIYQSCNPYFSVLKTSGYIAKVRDKKGVFFMIKQIPEGLKYADCIKEQAKL